MRFYTFVLKNVIRRRVRSSLTVIGMAVAVGAVVALVGISSGFERSFLNIYQKQKVDIIVQQRGVKQKLTSVLDAKLEDEIKKIPGVKQINSGLVDFTSMDELGPVGVLVQGWQPDSPLMLALQPELLPGGHLLTYADKKGVLLGERLAISLDKKVGDKMTIFDDETYVVKGVFRSGTVYENGSMTVLLEDLQRFMGREGQVSGFAIVVDNPDDKAAIERIRLDIEKLGKNVEATPTAQFVNATQEIQFVRAMAWVTSAVALIIGAVGMLNTMVMSVFERTREIGILRAIGWGRWRVVRMILMESILLSLTGGVVGAAGAVALTHVLANQPAVAGMVDSYVAPSVIAQGFLIALCVGLLGAAYPAYRGAQLLPTEALRHE
jgi:putative ABC transport system permease protein